MEQLSQALAEVRQQLGEAQRLATEAQRAGVRTAMTSTGSSESARDEQVSNLLRSRHTEWSEWFFTFESVAAMANLEPADGRCIHWIGRETVCRAHS